MFICRHKVKLLMKVIHVTDIYGRFVKLIACNINNQSVFNTLFFITGSSSDVFRTPSTICAEQTYDVIRHIIKTRTWGIYPVIFDNKPSMSFICSKFFSANPKSFNSIIKKKFCE